MKAIHLISTFAALAITTAFAAEPESQSSAVAGSGSSSATARQAGAVSGSDTSTAASMAFHNGKPYIIQNSQAQRWEPAVVQDNKMLTSDGQWVEVPDGIAGLNRKSSNIADGGSASATARQSGAVSGSQTGGNAQDGWIMQDGKLYRVENGRATMVDESAIPNGQMMNSKGELMATPTGIDYNKAGKGSNAPRNEQSSGSRSDAKPQR